MMSSFADIGPLSLSVVRKQLRKSFWTLSTSTTPTTSRLPLESSTPKTSHPPAVLENADTVAYAASGTPCCAFLNSTSFHSYRCSRAINSSLSMRQLQDNTYSRPIGFGEFLILHHPRKLYRGTLLVH